MLETGEDSVTLRMGPWKMVEISLGVASLLLALGDFWLWNQYARSLPIVENLAEGRLYPLNTHGHIVYLTRFEHTLLYALIFSSAAFFVAAILIDILKKPFRP